MIETQTGDLLRSEADALVNTVNTVGIMGKGIALQFKRAWPDMYRDYERACARGEIQLGRMHVWETRLLTSPRYIINFPTKKHWRSSSRLSDIAAGLQDLIRIIDELGIKSIALPPLGCGNGGLQWADVEPLMYESLFPISKSTDVIIFAPSGAPAAASMVNREPPPTLNEARSSMLALMHAYLGLAMSPPSLIEIQKLAYFLQESGEDLGMHFERHIYGPYADALRRAVSALEGHYITGFGDGSAKVTDAEPIELLPSAIPAVENYLRDHPAVQARINAVLEEISGFESAYGLELLASVHWVMAHDPQARDDPSVAHAQIHSWNQRKSTMFTRPHVQEAWSAIRDRGLVAV